MELPSQVRLMSARVRINYFLVGANLLMFVATLILSSLSQNNNIALYLLGAEHFPSIMSGEIWRLLTPAFLHASVIHLFVNMYTLINVGSFIESFYGSRKLLTVYVITAIGGALVSSLFTALTMTGNPADFTISVGASGAIFGLIGLLLGNNYKKSDYAPQLPISTGPLWTFVIFNLAIGFGFNFFGGPVNVNNGAHLGGFIFGVLLGLILEPINSFDKSEIKKLFENTLFMVSIAALLVAYVAMITSLLAAF